MIVEELLEKFIVKDIIGIIMEYMNFIDNCQYLDTINISYDKSIINGIYTHFDGSEWRFGRRYEKEIYYFQNGKMYVISTNNYKMIKEIPIWNEETKSISGKRYNIDNGGRWRYFIDENFIYCVTYRYGIILTKHDGSYVGDNVDWDNPFYERYNGFEDICCDKYIYGIRKHEIFVMDKNWRMIISYTFSDKGNTGKSGISILHDRLVIVTIGWDYKRHISNTKIIIIRTNNIGELYHISETDISNYITAFSDIICQDGYIYIFDSLENKVCIFG